MSGVFRKMRLDEITRMARVGILILIGFFFLNAHGQTQDSSHFSRMGLAVKGQILRIIPSDLNGDSLKDLMVVYRTGFSFNTERWLAVFIQTKGEAFHPSPDIIWEAPEECSIIDVANIDGSAGEEIILLTTNGVSCYREISVKEPPLLEKLIDVDSVTKVPAKKDLFYFDICKDWLGRGKSELLIPGFLTSTFIDSHFLEKILSGKKLPKKLDSPSSLQKGSDDELFHKLEIPSFSHYVPGTQEALFSSFAFPSVSSLDENGDHFKDIIALRENRLFIFHQGQDHKLPASPSKIVELDILTPEEKESNMTHYSVALDDINGDGIADAYAWKMRAEGFANFVGDSRIFFGKKGTGLGEKPDHVLTIPHGYYVSTNSRDYDGDGKKEISLFSIKFGLWGYIKMFLTHKLKVYINIFKLDQDLRYSDIPVLTDSYSIKIDLSREFDIPAYQIADFNGDRNQDLVLGTKMNEFSLFLGTGMKNDMLFFKDPSDSITVDAYPVIAANSLKGDEYNDLIFFYTSGSKSKGKIIVMKNNRIW
jgi:hypothetical protein